MYNYLQEYSFVIEHTKVSNNLLLTISPKEVQEWRIPTTRGTVAMMDVPKKEYGRAYAKIPKPLSKGPLKNNQIMNLRL